MFFFVWLVNYQEPIIGFFLRKLFQSIRLYIKGMILVLTLIVLYYTLLLNNFIKQHNFSFPSK